MVASVQGADRKEEENAGDMVLQGSRHQGCGS